MIKKIILAACLISSFNLIFAQDKISGIGIFKIGITNTSIIQTICDEFKTKLKTDYNTSKYENSKNKIVELKIDSTKEFYKNSVYVSECPNSQVFFISQYEISGFKISNIYLSFLRDTLVSISLDMSTELKTALTVKYGEPKLKAEKKEVECIGNKKTETIYTSTWENGDIVATDLLSTQINTFSCRESIYQSFSITSGRLIKQSSDCSETAKADRLKRQLGSKLKSL